MLETDKKVSIVLPTYNGAKYLWQSIDSCLNQTYKNIELIIVDDGSVDETPQIIRSYQDERIKYVRHDDNKRLPQALNTGFAISTGEYLTWTSDDNYYAEDAIESMLNLLQINKAIDFVYANYYAINDNGAVLQSVNVGPSEGLKEYNCIGPCFLYRRKVYKVLGGYNPQAFLAEDYEYWIRIFKRFRMEKLDKFIYWHRLHPQSLTGRLASEAKDRADKIRDHYFKIRAILRPISNYLSTGISYVVLGVRVVRRLLRTVLTKQDFLKYFKRL
jgi:glycosyltransferase involved in cell wall biosynthesis